MLSKELIRESPNGGGGPLTRREFVKGALLLTGIAVADACAPKPLRPTNVISTLTEQTAPPSSTPEPSPTEDFAVMVDKIPSHLDTNGNVDQWIPHPNPYVRKIDKTKDKLPEGFNPDIAKIKYFNKYLNLKELGNPENSIIFGFDDYSQKMLSARYNGYEWKWHEATLREKAESLGKFSIGVATSRYNDNRKRTDSYLEQLSEQFDIFHPMGVFYMENIKPNESSFTDKNTYNFNLGNKEVLFANQNHMKIHAEPLLGGNLSTKESNDLPSWFENKEYTSEELEAIENEYISNVVGNFKSIPEWTVALEPMFLNSNNEAGFMPDILWYQVLGSRYIEIGLKAANQADPNAELMIDEGQIETINPKSDLLYQLASDYKNRGIPLHAIGMEFELDAANNLDHDSIVQNVKRFQDLGLKVKCTSLRVNVSNFPGSDEDKFKRQGELFSQVMDICMETGIQDYSFWGMTEADAFRFGSNYYPPMFDANGNPRASFTAVDNRLNQYIMQP